ncbi:N,N-dimethylformamidase beta subunit family domain-containing protein [Microbacterium sp. 18062]|uniref:N,N-dimethylformamidase beta subunit family domain-containing protein n=1 Tax=Microbacterium sp. 18062 TaxID=2681410 RepID=UPI00135B8B7D|nr:N,N-dimethylformamidase beta subunit family domain-containing protein [Microbacterium sp. 18062]
MGEQAPAVVVTERVMGYTDRVSYRPGDRIALHVSTAAAQWTGELVRLQALAIPSAGVERRTVPVPAVDPVGARGVVQPTEPGSFARFPGVPVGEDGLTVAFAMMPTRPGDAVAGAQVVVAQALDGAGWWIGLTSEGRAMVGVGTSAGPVSLSAGEPLAAGCWVEVVARIPGRAGGRLSIEVSQAGSFASNRFVRRPAPPETASAVIGARVVASPGSLVWGCRALRDGRTPEHLFDGRIENPVIVADAEAPGDRAELARHPRLLAAWDLAAGIGREGVTDTSGIVDVGPHGLHGVAVQHPHRLVTSSGWRGDVFDARFAPAEYAAMHFHRDDLTDCGWVAQRELALPDDLPSGVYAVRLTASDGTEDLVPVFVAPPRGAATAPLLLVLPTNSYLAYANDHVGVDSPRTQVWSQMVPTLDDYELFRNARRELGLSLYEVHGDGSPVFYSSWRRPILTLRERVYDHNAPVWQFTSDMQLVDWLERTGRPYDVVTDLDLHREGAAMLSRYAAVLTGTHPEYASGPMLEAYEEYASSGGRVLYMGGNGMYWVTGYDPQDEQVIEIRRWGATQAWLADPGEYHLSSTGEQGGIWRFRGRAPQKSFGVGFVAAGNPGASAGYRRATRDPRVQWVFEGIDDADFGRSGVSGGAAGLEIDSASAPFGTSPDAVVLATSVGHSDDMLESRENYNMTSRILGGARNPRVRSDLTLVPREGGGAVFSTGSIGFAGALYGPDEDGDGRTHVARLLGNVIDRFLSGGPVIDL